MSKPGYVYILSNESMPGLVKIGKSINGGKSRALNLYQTGVPQPFNLEFELFAPNPSEIESLAHERLQSYRVNFGREFFKIEVSEAIHCIMDIFGANYNLTTKYSDFVPDDEDMAYLVYQLHEQGIRLSPPDIYMAINELYPDDVTDALIRYFNRVQLYHEKYRKGVNG